MLKSKQLLISIYSIARIIYGFHEIYSESNGTILF